MEKYKVFVTIDINERTAESDLWWGSSHNLVWKGHLKSPLISFLDLSILKNQSNLGMLTIFVYNIMVYFTVAMT